MNKNGTIGNPTLGDTLQSFASQEGSVGFFGELIPNIVGLLFVFGVLAFFFMLLAGSVTWIMSGGDKASLESARGKISNSIIGIVILFSVFAIISLIELFFGFDILSLDIGALKI